MISDDCQMVKVFLPKEKVAQIDKLRSLCGMNRSEFCATCLEITLETEEPLISFTLKFGKFAKKLWPEWFKGKKVKILID